MNIPAFLHKRRSELMGLSILMVVCFHAEVSTPSRLLNHLFFQNGNMGVDIFALLAGFGCAFSLERDDRFAPFYARRMKRLLPPYYAALLLMLAAFGCGSAVTFVAHVIPIGVWVGQGAAYWYVHASMLYYLLIPALRWLLCRARRPRAMFIALFACLGLLVPFAATESGPSIAVARLPVLVVGVALGVFYHIHETKKDRRIDAALVLGVYAAGLFIVAVRRTGFLRADWFSSIMARRLHQDLRAPALAALLAAAFDALERTPLRFLNAGLRKLGKYTLAIYLSHIIVRNAATAYCGLAGWPLLAAMLALSLPLALGIDMAGRWLLKLWEKLPILKSTDA